MSSGAAGSARCNCCIASERVGQPGVTPADTPISGGPLKGNVAKVRLKERTRVYLKDVIPFVERLAAGAYDIAYCDPPYGSKKLDRVVAQWRKVPFARILVVEHAPDHVLDLDPTTVVATLRVDDAMVTILQAATPAQPA